MSKPNISEMALMDFIRIMLTGSGLFKTVFVMEENMVFFRSMIGTDFIVTVHQRVTSNDRVVGRPIMFSDFEQLIKEGE